jgi:hypothetical protein
MVLRHTVRRRHRRGNAQPDEPFRQTRAAPGPEPVLNAAMPSERGHRQICLTRLVVRAFLASAWFGESAELPRILRVASGR